MEGRYEWDCVVIDVFNSSHLAPLDYDEQSTILSIDRLNKQKRSLIFTKTLFEFV